MNTHLERSLGELRRELAELDSQRKKVKHAVDALEALHRGSPGKKRRANNHDHSGDVPDELRDLAVTDRVIHVMSTEPARAWKTKQLSEATYCFVRNTLWTSLTRLAERGRIEQTATDTWRLIPSGAAPTE